MPFQPSTAIHGGERVQREATTLRYGEVTVSFVFGCRVLVILGGLDQVVDVNVEIVVVFDVVDGGLGGDLVDD